MKEYNKQYYLEHSERIKQCSKQYYLEHFEQHKQYRKQNYEQWKKNNRNRYLELKRKAQDKRHRALGFEPLNEWQFGYVAHHVNLKKVIYIPEEIHKLIPHNVMTGKNMHIINGLAVEFIKLKNQLRRR